MRLVTFIALLTALLIVALLATTIALSSRVAAQTHDLHHAYYQNWVNGINQGCCNDRDCKELADAEERSVAGRLEVLIVGVGVVKDQVSWCPVLPHHYLRTGNAPNWSSSHVCVTGTYGGATPCEQFVCYQPKPLH